MNLYLIMYGSENEMVTFQADDPNHAIEQFCSWAPVDPDWQPNRDAITAIYLCNSIEMGDL